MDGEEDYMAQMPIINESKFKESIKTEGKGGWSLTGTGTYIKNGLEKS